MSETAYRIDGFAGLDETKMCYWKADEGNWYLHLPGCGIGNLAAHKVVEHEDGSITVTPSIAVIGHDSGKPTRRHGYLTRGVWTEC